MTMTQNKKIQGLARKALEEDGISPHMLELALLEAKAGNFKGVIAICKDIQRTFRRFKGKEKKKYKLVFWPDVDLNNPQ